MSWLHIDAALLLEGIPAAPKTVLVHLGQPACEVCGLSWAGIGWLERKTGLGRTAVKAALDWLVHEHYLQVFAYPQGGRGRSTEYIVLPLLVQLSTPRCGKCVSNMQRGRHATGIDQDMTTKQVATRPVLHKPVAGGGQKGSPGDPQSVIESESVTALRAQVDPPATPAGAATPPSSDPTPPLNRAENAHKARELLHALGDQLGPPSRHTVKDDPSSAETTGHQPKAARQRPRDPGSNPEI